MPRPRQGRSQIGLPVQHHANEFADEETALAFEDQAWWYVGRRAILRRFLERARPIRPLERIVEIGCGSGPHLSLLAEYGAVTALEPSATLAARCRSRGSGARVIAGDLSSLAASESFDLTCLFDVLEHIEDDRGFLHAVNRHLPADGLLLLSVPANPWLYGPHDALLHHVRRYSKRGLEQLLSDAGYRVVHGSFFLSTLFPAAILARLAERARAAMGRPPTAVNLGAAPPRINRLLTWLLAAEGALADRHPLPFGLWLIYLAQRV
jgi:SAM-dependent methyltransferase